MVYHRPMATDIWRLKLDHASRYHPWEYIYSPSVSRLHKNCAFVIIALFCKLCLHQQQLRWPYGKCTLVIMGDN